MTLRTRLSIAVSLLLVVIALAGVLLIRTVEESQIQQIENQIETVLPIAMTLGIRPPQDLPLAHSSIDLNGVFSNLYVAVLANRKRTVTLDPSVAHGDAPRLPSVTSTDNLSRLEPQTVGSLTGSDRWRAVVVESPRSGHQVLVAVSLVQADATTNRLKIAVLAAGLSMLVVLAAAYLWVVRLGLRPIAEVTRVADAIISGEKGRRLRTTASRTEAAHLARALNVMIDEQQTLETRLRQFIADASHEMRTPMTTILGFAQLWRRGAFRSGVGLDDAMRRIGQESLRMSGLIEDLLLLARLDDGLPLQREEVDLDALVRDGVLDALARYPSREIRADCANRIIVVGDEAKLRQVISNLLNNAVIHTPNEASVMVLSYLENENAVIEVTDTGGGMDDLEVERAFDRFWRGNASRPVGGSGLGLSIVASIVSAHDGDVSISSAKGMGTTVRVVLPTSSGPASTSKFSEGVALAPNPTEALCSGNCRYTG